LFLETSAQIARLLESKSIRSNIEELCRRFGRVGTSAFALAEFEANIGGFMKTVAAVLKRLPHRDRERRFDQLWLEVEDLLPYWYPGKALASKFALAMMQRYRRVSPAYLEKTLEAQRSLLIGRFTVVGGVDMRKGNTMFDRTSCCLWEVRTAANCERADQAHSCRLRGNCWAEREKFEETVRYLSGARVEESTVLKEKVSQLSAITDHFSYLKAITNTPNAFGDILILSEVPEKWSLLTKDYAFVKLQQHQSRDVEVLKVRLPRKRRAGTCSVRPVEAQNAEPVIEATLVNESARDVGLVSSVRIGRCKSRVAVMIDGIWRKGYVAREEVRRGGGYAYGIRITAIE
jgi:hypothetical protein